MFTKRSGLRFRVGRKPVGELSFPLDYRQIDNGVCRKAGKAPQGAHMRSVYKCTLVKRSKATFSVGDRKEQKKESDTYRHEDDTP